MSSRWSGRVVWIYPALCVVLHVSPCLAQSGRDTLIEVETQVRSLYGVVLLYHAEHKVWPSTLNEACGGYPSPRCVPLGVQDTTPLDFWGLPLYYSQTRNGFVIRSLGPDRRPGTSDDLVISYPSDRWQAGRIAGCYRPVAGWWNRAPADMRLNTLRGTLWDHGGGYGVTGQFPGQQQLDAEWFPTTPDSVVLEWLDGTTIRILRLRITGDTLRGYVDFDDLNWKGALKFVKASCAP